MTARVCFEVRLNVAAPAERLWAALSDWRGHGEWIPATRIEWLTGDGAVGSRFIAHTGFRPLVLADAMTVTARDEATFSAAVEKTGAAIQGRAGFSVAPAGDSCQLLWWEDLTVPLAPAWSAPLQAAVGKRLFALSIRRLARRLDRMNQG